MSSGRRESFLPVLLDDFVPSVLLIMDTGDLLKITLDSRNKEAVRGTHPVPTPMWRHGQKIP